MVAFQGNKYSTGRVKITTSNQVNKSTARLQVFRKSIAVVVTKPVVSILAKTGVTPDMVTWFGFILILAASVLAGIGHLVASGCVVLISGFFDIIDGALARGTNQVTRFGAVLDSTLDRVSEAVILLGITAYYLFNSVANFEWIVLIIGLAILGSFLVSYVRARAEGIGLDCQVGIFTRTERVIILALGLLFSGIDMLLVVVLIIITVMSFVTIVQRMAYVAKQLKK
jgi:CDP-diacylglycerol--glycerol-3-phosphate 3-phosphatidyltransferase